MLAIGDDPMTSRKSILRLSAMFLTIISMSVTAQEQNGVSKFRDVKAPGAIETDTYAVNNFGVIAGDYVDANHVQHGMILSAKGLVTVDRAGCLSVPGPGAIALYAIASKDGAVGWCEDTSTGRDDAFLYMQGRFVNIAPPGAVSTQAHGLNDLGEIVGTYVDSSGAQHGFLLKGTNYTVLNVPGHTLSNAWSINNQGWITIFALNANQRLDSFISKGSSYRLVNVPGAAQSIIHAIDSFGDRIYTALDSDGNEHGVFFLKGVYHKFSDPNDRNKSSTRAFGLNDKLEIIGDYSRSGLNRPAAAQNQGFLAYGCCR
jgi:hypothetical protein